MNHLRHLGQMFMTISKIDNWVDENIDGLYKDPQLRELFS